MKKKLKTRKSLKKRLRLTAKGKFKRGKAGKSHLLSGKKRKRKRNLRKAGLLAHADKKTLEKGLPYS